MENNNEMIMTVDGLHKYCENNHYMPDDEASKKLTCSRSDLMPKFVLDLQDKMLDNFCKNLFRTAINEIQSDEKALLCFMGLHKFKSIYRNLGSFAYILTNRRLIMTGLVKGLSDAYNPATALKNLRAFKKEYECKAQSLYLNELTDVTVDMVNGCDILKFHTNKEIFHVAMFHKDTSHKLCREIHGVLDELRNEQDIKNANR